MGDAPRLDTDVLTVGVTYRDLIMTGLPSLPRLGEERHATALHETWGGISNMTRVCRALGLRTAMSTPLGDDVASAQLVSDMTALGIDMSLSRTHPGWRLPTTVALSTSEDRAMATVEVAPPGGVTAHLDNASFQADSVIVDMRDPVLPWIDRVRSEGAVVYASRGFDATGAWSTEALIRGGACDVWMLNELESTAFTGAKDAREAARLLSAKVPLVVVTRGASGLLAVDAARGEEAEAPAFAVEATGTTGAGDSALASFVFANRLPSLTLAQRLDVVAFVVATILSSPSGAADPPHADELLTRARTIDDPRAGHIAAALAGRA